MLDPEVFWSVLMMSAAALLEAVLPSFLVSSRQYPSVFVPPFWVGSVVVMLLAATLFIAVSKAASVPGLPALPLIEKVDHWFAWGFVSNVRVPLPDRPTVTCGLTVIVMAADVVVAPSSSSATAVSVLVPAGAPVHW